MHGYSRLGTKHLEITLGISLCPVSILHLNLAKLSVFPTRPREQQIGTGSNQDPLSTTVFLTSACAVLLKT